MEKRDEEMKFIKSLKIIDLIISILFIILFFYKYRITASYEYGLGQMIDLLVRLPAVFLLLISMIMSIIAVCNKKNIYLFSIISQILKIVAFLLNFVISRFILEVIFKLDYMVAIPIYAIIILIILMTYKIIRDSKSIPK